MLTGPIYGPATRGAPQALVVLLHGVGADGADLIGLAPALAQALPRTLFVAPDAPEVCDMTPFGRQWFSLQDRRPEAMLAGIRAAAASLDAYLDSLLEQHRLPAGRLALVGFSQGAIMALHVGLRRPTAIAALVGFSGVLLGAEALPGEIRVRPPVLLVHGDADEIVPVAALDHALAALESASVPVRGLRCANLAHAVDQVGIDAAAAFLWATLPDA